MNHKIGLASPEKSRMVKRRSKNQKYKHRTLKPEKFVLRKIFGPTKIGINCGKYKRIRYKA